MSAATPLPRGALGMSTHGFGLAEALELARALGQLPRRCIVYAIEGASFETGAPLSPEVAAAVDGGRRGACAPRSPSSWSASLPCMSTR